MAANTNGLLCWLQKTWFSILIVGVVVAAITWAVDLNSTAESNKEDIVKIERTVDANEKAIIGLQHDVSYIKEGVDEIRTKLR